MLYNTTILRYPFLSLHPASSSCFNSSFSPKTDGFAKGLFMLQRCKSWCGASFRQWFFLFCVFCVQLMVNCWFGLVVWILGIPLWKGLLLNGTLRIPNHRAPNQQLTISWCVWLCLLDFGLVPAPVSSNLLYRSPISMFPSFSMTGMMRINLDLWRVFTQMMIPQVIKKVDN